jgi:hypothetical protein
MDEDIPNNKGTKKEKFDEELVKLLREFLELEIAQLRFEQQDSEERQLEVEQYGEDADDAYFYMDWAIENC